MPIRTKDERVIVADAAIETALATMVASDNGFDRVAAFKLIVRRVMRKSVVNKTRGST